jgi:hypothetical protein
MNTSKSLIWKIINCNKLFERNISLQEINKKQKQQIESLKFAREKDRVNINILVTKISSQKKKINELYQKNKDYALRIRNSFSKSPAEVSDLSYEESCIFE